MDLARFDAGYADAVVRSFRDDAIRTAVLIDDQFPSYTEMREAKDADFKEVERAIKLWTNPGETGLSPFGGIGSEGVGALTAGRTTLPARRPPT